jgi:hypothetical protein
MIRIRSDNRYLCCELVTLDRGDQGGLFGLSLHYRTRKKAVVLSHLMDVTGRGGFIFVLRDGWEGYRWMGDGVGGCGGGGRNFESPCGARRFGCFDSRTWKL